MGGLEHRLYLSEEKKAKQANEANERGALCVSVS